MKSVDKMAVNTCRVRINKSGQVVTTRAVLSTTNTELHVFMLTYSP